RCWPRWQAASATARSRARLGLTPSRLVNCSLLCLFLRVAWAALPASHFRRSWIPAALPVLPSAIAFFTSALGLLSTAWFGGRRLIARGSCRPGRLPTRLLASALSILWAVSLYCSAVAVLNVSPLAWICRSAALKLICRGVSGLSLAAPRRC